MQIFELTSFIAGALSTTLAYVMFSDKGKGELEAVADIEDIEHEHDDTTGRRITMMCVSCRKQKRHVEIEKDLYQCTKCKREVDLRR